MSTIPNSAMPHAIDHEPEADATSTDDAVANAREALGGLIKDVEDFARGLGERIKGAPRGAQIAAGAVVVGGLVAAAAVPLVRAVRKPAAAPKPKPKRAAPTAAAKPKRTASTAPRATSSRATSPRKPKGGTAA